MELGWGTVFWGSGAARSGHRVTAGHCGVGMPHGQSGTPWSRDRVSHFGAQMSWDQIMGSRRRMVETGCHVFGPHGWGGAP
ncbi:hypothetical protein R1flu_002482 [Riccia fluitans]|uniref:Uncharacterized protein n=1 Tax=Riccia fluitans TaxID=41844 RepID=A0ABD1Y9K8_9MARC